MLYKIIGDIGQWFAVAFNLIGLIYMFVQRIDLGTIFIVLGALLLTLATKIKYYGQMIHDDIKCKQLRMKLEIDKNAKKEVQL